VGIGRWGHARDEPGLREGEEDPGLAVMEESAPPRDPAAEGVESDSAGAGDHRDVN
jgi:hypothetical protein